MVSQHAPGRFSSVNGRQETAMQFDGASFDRTPLEGAEVAARYAAASVAASEKDIPADDNVPKSGAVYYLPVRNPSSAASEDSGSLRERCADLVAAALSWVLNEIIQGLAAYADTMHPGFLGLPREPSGQPGTVDSQNAADQSANPQTAGARSRDEAYVTAMMMRSNAWFPSSLERRGR
jgi:hypothetical protein